MSALTDTFTAIANKIRNKLGVETTYTPSEMPSGIDDVYTAGIAATKVGTAVAGDVLSGKTFTNASSVGANGSMTNQGNKSFTISDASAVAIPAGYYNGSGNIQTSGMMVIPTATKSITSNGNNQDVLDYSKVNVNVPCSPTVSKRGSGSSLVNTASASIPIQPGRSIVIIIRPAGVNSDQLAYEPIFVDTGVTYTSLFTASWNQSSRGSMYTLIVCDVINTANTAKNIYPAVSETSQYATGTTSSYLVLQLEVQ